MAAVSEKYGFGHKVRYHIARVKYGGIWPSANGNSLVRIAETFRPDLTIVIRGELLQSQPVERLRELSGVGCINIYPDSPFVIPGASAAKMCETLEKYTCIYTFSQSLVPVFEQLGAGTVSWLPFGFDPLMHRIVDNVDKNWMTNIAYLGAWGPIQEKWLEQLSPLGLAIYGPGWNHAKKNTGSFAAWREGRGVGGEMSNAICGAEIVFNLIRSEHGCAHSMKTFEIPACGGFMLTNWTEEQSIFFEDGKHCVYFHTKEEMIDKVKFYLKNSGLRRKIAEAGSIEVQKHSYIIRSKKILCDLTS